jgi:3-vinyl bacteriochlorophyllide hydratase
MAVIALHTAYLGCWLFGIGSTEQQLWIALAAYATYVINAAQFLLKLRAARRDETRDPNAGNWLWQGATE